jgi:hypothetical protein
VQLLAREKLIHATHALKIAAAPPPLAGSHRERPMGWQESLRDIQGRKLARTTDRAVNPLIFLASRRGLEPLLPP